VELILGPALMAGAAAMFSLFVWAAGAQDRRVDKQRAAAWRR
jgi:hypothetical protein